MGALYIVPLASIGNGIYTLAQGNVMAGFGEIFVAVAGTIVVLVYQQSQNKDVERKGQPLKRPRRPMH